MCAVIERIRRHPRTFNSSKRRPVIGVPKLISPHAQTKILTNALPHIREIHYASSLTPTLVKHADSLQTRMLRNFEGRNYGKAERSWRRPTACDLNPFSKTAALLALDIDNVSVAFTSATDSVLLDWIRYRPVIVFLLTLLFIGGSLLKEW